MNSTKKAIKAMNNSKNKLNSEEKKLLFKPIANAT